MILHLCAACSFGRAEPSASPAGSRRLPSAAVCRLARGRPASAAAFMPSASARFLASSLPETAKASFTRHFRLYSSKAAFCPSCCIHQLIIRRLQGHKLGFGALKLALGLRTEPHNRCRAAPPASTQGAALQSPPARNACFGAFKALCSAHTRSCASRSRKSRPRRISAWQSRAG